MTELVYPDDAPPLIPRTTYLTQLELIGASAQADQSFFFVLDEASRKEVVATEAAIRALSLDPAATAFLLAEIYRQNELRSAAISQLESLAGDEARPDLAGQLGDLYFEVGLYNGAETNYQAALSEAQLSNVPAAQARALAGLGRVADAYGEKKAAISHFQTAEALYLLAGDLARAEAVAQILARLVASPEMTSPRPAATP